MADNAITLASVSELTQAQPLFSGLSNELMARLISEAKLANFSPGEPLIRENGSNQQLFLIVEGRASAISNGTRIGSITAGELAGEISSAQISPPVATVRAETNLTALTFPASLIADIAGKNAGFASRLRKTAFQRISG